MIRNITCTACPLGCRLQAKIEDGQLIEVTGNSCGRGAVFAQQECLRPTRMVTASIILPESGKPLSVRTATPIAKELINACLQALKQARPQLPIKSGDVLIKNVSGSGVDIIATKSYLK